MGGKGGGTWGRGRGLRPREQAGVGVGGVAPPGARPGARRWRLASGTNRLTKQRNRGAPGAGSARPLDEAAGRPLWSREPNGLESPALGGHLQLLSGAGSGPGPATAPAPLRLRPRYSPFREADQPPQTLLHQPSSAASTAVPGRGLRSRTPARWEGSPAPILDPAFNSLPGAAFAVQVPRARTVGAMGCAGRSSSRA